MSESGLVTGRAAGAQRRRRVLVGATALVVAAVICGAVLVAVGSITTVPGSGLLALDVRVSWLLPATRLVMDVAGAVTVGCLVAASLLLPGVGTVSPPGYRWLRWATWPAVIWAVAAAVAAPGLLVEFLNTDLANVSLSAVMSFLWEIPQGNAQAAVVALAGLVAVGSRWVLTVAGARTLLVIALVAAVPPQLAEYAEAEGSAAEVAVQITAMALHVLGALVWSGALVALLFAGRLPAGDLAVAVQRYSRMAPALVLAVGASGLLTAVLQLNTPGQLFASSFGRLVLLKTLALTVLIIVGWWHRRSSLDALTLGRPGAFRRIAAAELVVFAATIGLAVGLSRTPAPEPDAAVVTVSDPAASVPIPSPRGDSNRSAGR